MMKLTNRTSHQIEALIHEGFVVENETASTCEVHGYNTWAELAARLVEVRNLARAGESHYYVSGKLAVEVADLADGDDTQAERVRRSVRRGHLTALASLDRYATDQAAIEAEAPTPKQTEKIVRQRKAAAAKKEQRRIDHGQPCGCGCGGTTGGGRYLPGHDAKHKSALIKAALAGENSGDQAEFMLGMSAYAELEERGWLRFLDKAREVAARPKADPKVARAERQQDVEARARENVARLELLKAAAAELRRLDRHKAGSLPWVEVTRENAQAIVDGTFDYEAYDLEVAR